jgi:hypothetical protein
MAPDPGGPKTPMDPVDPDPDADQQHCFYIYIVLFGKTYCDVHYIFTRNGASYAEVVNNPSGLCDARCSVISLRILFFLTHRSFTSSLFQIFTFVYKKYFG